MHSRRCGRRATTSRWPAGSVARQGWPQVSERLGWGATQYVEGARTHRLVSRYVGADLAYVVLRETITFKRPTDRREMAQELRVTEIFHREAGRWRIVHRARRLGNDETDERVRQGAGPA